MRIHTLLILLIISFNAHASDILDKAYNSFNFGVSSSFGDVEATATSASINFKPQNVGVILSYSHSDTEYDKALNTDINGLDGDIGSFSLGYLIKASEDSHVIPFISTGSAEVSYSSRAISSDITNYGLIWRSLSSDNCVLNFSLTRVSYDDTEIAEATRNDINNTLNSFGLSSLTDEQFDSIERDLISDATILGVGLEYHYAENVTLSYALATDFDTTSLSLGLGWNF